MSLPTVRRYQAADAARCCEVVNAAIEEMDGLNEAARLFVRGKNTPAGLGAELGRWLTLVCELDDVGLVGLGEHLGYTRGELDRLVLGDATFEYVMMHKYVARSK